MAIDHIGKLPSSLYSFMKDDSLLLTTKEVPPCDGTRVKLSASFELLMFNEKSILTAVVNLNWYK